MSRQISHDPFARESLHRMTVNVSLPHGGCAFCGYKITRKGGPHRDGCDYRLYRYWIESDDSSRRSYLHDGRLFCSVQCVKNYN